MKVSAVERGKYLVSGAKWSEKTCNNQNALLHTWLINTLMGSSQITRINVGKVQTQMLTLYVHYCLSSALVSFRHKNHLVRKTSWFSLKRLFDLQKHRYKLFAVYFEISSGFYIYTSLSWATGAAAYKWKCYVTKDTQVTREHVIVATRLDVPPACLGFARHPGNLRWPTGDRQ